MFRRELIPLLLYNPLRLSELASLCKTSIKEVIHDLQHLSKTLKRSKEHRFAITPAVCRKCSFTFSTTKISRPGKCPVCRSTWIDEPVVQVLPRE